MKADEGKLKISLVPTEIIRAVARVRMFGTEKYKDPENWRNVEKQRYKDALLRHILAWWEDEDSVDEESGLNHLEHAATNIAFILEMKKGEAFRGHHKTERIRTANSRRYNRRFAVPGFISGRKTRRP